MNIKILDSWLRDYLKTDASAKQIADSLSLTSVSIERVEPWKNDWLYDIEVTTNRPDLASVVGIAREAGAVLPQSDIPATFTPPELPKPNHKTETGTTYSSDLIKIKNNPDLVSRVLAVVMEVAVKDSPQYIKDRLESSDIRSLNNIIDVTNYVMRTIGYPTHVFDYDRLKTKQLEIRESRKNEKITTLDGKEHILQSDDIVADDGTGHIVDLLGVMGLENSVVTAETKRIMFFINHVEPHHVRKTSLGLGIRTEAAQLNEKVLDPELAYTALQYGIKLYEEVANGKQLGEIVDIYPRKPEKRTVSVSEEKINRVLGIELPLKTASDILEKLGFATTIKEKTITAVVPSFRLGDIEIPEDLIEEIARVYGYQNLPDELPPIASGKTTTLGDNPFYWERRVKEALKYWGYTEVYTYPLVSETMYEGPLEDSVKLQNPLGEEFAYMRRSLIPSLLNVIKENKRHDSIKIFEVANVYEKVEEDLPLQIRKLGLAVKHRNASFFNVKGVIEQLAKDLGVSGMSFKPLSKSGLETEILVGKEILGGIEILDEETINAEVNFEKLIAHASLHKSYTPLAKYPPVIEDLSLVVPDEVMTGSIIETIFDVSPLIADVSLLDRYQDTRTFHILYQDPTKNLTTDEVKEVRDKILEALNKSYDIRLKS